MTKKERRKKKQTILRNKKLCKRYPFIIPRYVWTGQVSKDYDYSYTMLDGFSGWNVGFGKFLLEDLRDACIKSHYLDKLYFVETKEKYGQMRLYTNAAPQEIHDVISKYEFISEHVCYNCGSPYAGLTNINGWILPVCDDCWNDFQKRFLQKGILKEPIARPVLEDILQLPDSYSYRTYSLEKGHETIIVDISDTVNKIYSEYEKREQKKQKRKR
jgi:hypothetical protein